MFSYLAWNMGMIVAIPPACCEELMSDICRSAGTKHMSSPCCMNSLGSSKTWPIVWLDVVVISLYLLNTCYVLTIVPSSPVLCSTAPSSSAMWNGGSGWVVNLPKAQEVADLGTGLSATMSHCPPPWKRGAHYCACVGFLSGFSAVTQKMGMKRKGMLIA